MEAESGTFEEGVTNLLSPRVFLQAVMVRAFPNVIDQTAEISVADGARAAAELQKMSAADADTDRMAKIVATQNRIIACMREVCPPELHEEILARCEGRPWPPPSGGRLALVEGGGDDDEPDPFSDDTEDYDQEDD